MRKLLTILLLLPLAAAIKPKPIGNKRILLPVQKDSIIYLIDLKNQISYQSGDTLVIPTATKYIKGVKMGNVCDAVIIQDDTSKTIGGYSQYSFVLNKASNVRVPYLKVDGKNKALSGVAVGEASNIHFGSIRVRNIYGIGIRIKTDPDTTKPKTLWPYVMDNISIDSAFAENVLNEGAYIGHSMTNLAALGGKLPMPLLNFSIGYFYSRHTGWDGFQISASINSRVGVLDIADYAYLNQVSQRNGFVSGSSTSYRDTIKSIRIENGPGAAWTIFSRDTIYAKNIRIKKAGYATGESGIYIDDYGSYFGLTPQKIFLEDVQVDSANKAGLYYVNKLLTGLPISVKNYRFTNTSIPFFDASKGTFFNPPIDTVIVKPPIDTIIVKPPVDTLVVIVQPVNDTVYITGSYTVKNISTEQKIVFTGRTAAKLYMPDKPIADIKLVIVNRGTVSLSFSKYQYFYNYQYRTAIKPKETFWIKYWTVKRPYVIYNRVF